MPRGDVLEPRRRGGFDVGRGVTFTSGKKIRVLGPVAESLDTNPWTRNSTVDRATKRGEARRRLSRISIERFSFGDDAEKEIKGECVCHHGGDTIHEVYSVFSRRYGAMSASLNQLCTSRNVLANTIVGSADIIYMDIAI
uniref:Uncharacterized protein n=1 Tax=Brassica campestris TaxID=3711 RepID=M4E170_BRACM